MELNVTERLLNSTLGVKSLLFRPPYGIDHQPETADEVAQLPIAQSMGYLIVGARIDPHDWGEPGGVPPAAASVIVQRVLEQARANTGNIVLLHDGGGDRSHTVRSVAANYRWIARRGISDCSGRRTGRADTRAADAVAIVPRASGGARRRR